MKVLEEFLKPTQKTLFKMLRKMYGNNAYVSEKNFILVQGDAPIMLLAHLDTVHSEPVRTICKSKDKNILMSPQGIGGDDRCEVYALVKIHELAPKKPWLLFTCDEEVGGLGANNFCLMHKHGKLPEGVDKLKCLVEINRKGSCDAVYYDCGNLEFERYVTGKGFVTSYGSFSDISVIAPELGVAAVNLSSGYYNAHTQHEYIVRSELENTIEQVVEMVADAAKDNFPKYSYVKKVYAPVKTYDWYRGYFRNDKKLYENSLVLRSEAEPLEEEDTLKKLPSEYEQIYYELLETYSAEELELLREQHGDQILYQIYIDDYGPFYAEQDRGVI